ncbi:hypothetical protein [Arthrobacter sp. H14-L1]|uniref:hypothetical protein n=1 Tax=Arthrobacter sp. H14-L1 TaxID=2996697 RepID=UPI00226E212E|nr:hypothetical protein [Arthrobacter sp. H14-L1]MCY0905763.1 hypothetical protein [Arthrobacter sp. H14-L1]
MYAATAIWEFERPRLQRTLRLSSLAPDPRPEGELFGYGAYVEGDTATYWFRAQDACFEAITADVFFHWTSGQSDGPDNLSPPPNCRHGTAGPTRAGAAKSF